MWLDSTGRQTGPGDFRCCPASVDCFQGGPQNSDDFNIKAGWDKPTAEKKNAVPLREMGGKGVSFSQSKI